MAESSGGSSYLRNLAQVQVLCQLAEQLWFEDNGEEVMTPDPMYLSCTFPSSFKMLVDQQAQEAQALAKTVEEPPTQEAEDSEGSASGSEGSSDVDIIIGPTEAAFSPKTSADLSLEGTGRCGERCFYKIQSRSRAAYFSDILRLTALGVSQGRRPLSFGSAVHLEQDSQSGGEPESCRPCMFERKSRHCRKRWLCDFCHLHVERAHRGSRKPGMELDEKNIQAAVIEASPQRNRPQLQRSELRGPAEVLPVKYQQPVLEVPWSMEKANPFVPKRLRGVALEKGGLEPPNRRHLPPAVEAKHVNPFMPNRFRTAGFETSRLLRVSETMAEGHCLTSIEEFGSAESSLSLPSWNIQQAVDGGFRISV